MRGASSDANASARVRGDRWVWPFFRQYKRALAKALALGLLTFVFASGLMVTSGYLIAGSAAVTTVLLMNIPLMFVQIFGLGKPVLQYSERLASHDWVLRMVSSMRRKLYAALERTALRPQAKRGTGAALGMLSDDIGHMQNLYLRVVFPMVIAWVIYAGIVVVLGLMTPWVACAMLFLLAVVVVVMPVVSLLAERARQARLKSMRDDMYATLTDNVLGVADWVFSGRGEEYLARHEASQAEMRALKRKSDAFARVRDVAAQVVFGLVVVVLLVWAAQTFGGAGGMLPNWIAAFALGFFPLIEVFAPVSQAAVDSLTHRESVARLNGLPDEAAPVADGPAAGKWRAPDEPYDIVLSDVHFAHEGALRAVLDGVSLRIPQGAKVAVLGRSGAGKSTMLSLIRGDAAPDAGSVTLGGVPCAELREAMPRYIGVIQQDTYLFNMSLLDNVRLGAPDASEAQVLAALRAVGLSELVARLPQGLATVVDEAGTRFSGGERHRIAIARVLLQDVPIVMLDEPMVGLDPACEREVLDTLFEALAGRTLIMVTHHLQGVSRMDDVVFLEGGRMKLHGTPAQLEAESEYYRMLRDFDRGMGL